MKPLKHLNLYGWLVAFGSSLVYLFTLEPTVSFWDCGEFIATSYGLQVGHPPGAPLYTLLAHCFTLLAGTDTSAVAWWSNALSAIAGGFTAMFLFWTLARLLGSSPQSTTHYSPLLPSLVGTACYVFCDTVWFSAVESEVYSLSMLFSAAIVWAMVRWMQCDAAAYAPRWLMLVSLLLGLSVGVHQLSLLTIPAIVLMVIFRRTKKRESEHSDKRMSKRSLLFLLPLFFLTGLTPYLIIPIRAAADPPINMGDPSSWTGFRSYVSRDQYEKAPLVYGRCFNSPVVAYEDGKPVYAPEMDMFFPRMWKQHANAELYYTDWTGKHGKMVSVNGKKYYKPSFGDNLILFGAYQLGYMYLRYLMWNFSGRYNDRQGFGNLQNGQFITGIPFIDRFYIGTGKPLPDSLPHAGHNRYYMLPLILGLIGVFSHFRRNKREAWVIMTLFLMSSIVLSLYLNHPVYEPRERDYAYVLSFYAFAVWIGVGAFAICKKLSKTKFHFSSFMLIGIPLLMACQNWDDHDRSGRYMARDSAQNLLNSCGEGGILFTSGDNDTFPLWYVQQVEGIRTDVHVVNISLLGSDSYANSISRLLQMAEDKYFALNGKGPYGRMGEIIRCTSRPVFFSHYAHDANRERFCGRFKLCGIAYRLDSIDADSVDCNESYRLFTGKLKWNRLDGVYIDETSYGFLRQYWNDAILVAENLIAQGQSGKAADLVDAVSRNVPVETIRELPLRYRVAQVCGDAGDSVRCRTIMKSVRNALAEQLDYYGGMSPAMRDYIQYTLEPLLRLQSELESK